MEDSKQHGVNISEQGTDPGHNERWETNASREKDDVTKKGLQDADSEEVISTDGGTFTEDSPFEEVRAAVRNTDGGEVANTVRAWILGMVFVTIGSGLNMFLSMR